MSKANGRLIFVENRGEVPEAYQYADELELSLYPKTWCAENPRSCVIGMSLPEENDLLAHGDAVALLLWHRRAALAARLDSAVWEKEDITRIAEQVLAAALRVSKFPRKNAQATIVTPHTADFKHTSFDAASFARHMAGVTEAIKQLLGKNGFSDIRFWHPENKKSGAAVECSSGDIYELPFDATGGVKTLDELQSEGALLTELEISQRKK